MAARWFLVTKKAKQSPHGGSVVSGHKKDKVSHRMAARLLVPEMTNSPNPWLLGGFRSLKMTTPPTHVSFCGLLGLRIYFQSLQMYTP